MKRSLFALPPLLLALASPAPAPAQELRAPSTDVTVMTRNLYAGVDDPSAVIAAVLAGDVPGILMATEDVWQQVRSTAFDLRSTALADEIAARRPLLVGLQEVAIWRTQYPADFQPFANAESVQYDFLELLLADLRARGLHYEPIASVTNLDLELPRWNGGDPEDVRWTDRDVILARVDEVKVRETASGNFSTYIDLGGGLAVPRGWTSATVKIQGVVLKVVETHLEDMNDDVRDAQAQELLAGPAAGDVRTILLGDFNDDANAGTATGAYRILRDAGFGDAWLYAHPGEPGPTCCQDATLLNADSRLTERIDLVLFGSGISVRRTMLTGNDPDDRVTGLWPSDHAGLFAALGVAPGAPR